MASNATRWQVDSATAVIRLDDGRWCIWWAGATFGPKNTLEELVTGDLLAGCKQVMTHLGKRVERMVCDWETIYLDDDEEVVNLSTTPM
jgi:hypothetical protein